jgi:hypothetical protein
MDEAHFCARRDAGKIGDSLLFISHRRKLTAFGAEK